MFSDLIIVINQKNNDNQYKILSMMEKGLLGDEQYINNKLSFYDTIKLFFGKKKIEREKDYDIEEKYKNKHNIV